MYLMQTLLEERTIMFTVFSVILHGNWNYHYMQNPQSDGMLGAVRIFKILAAELSGLNRLHNSVH